MSQINFNKQQENENFTDVIEETTNANNSDFISKVILFNDDYHTFDQVIAKLCNLSTISYVNEKIPNAASFIVKSTEFYIPVSSKVDKETEINKLLEELNYTRGFLISVLKKLENERFISTAPSEVVEKEKKKKADAENRIKVIEIQLMDLKK